MIILLIFFSGMNFPLEKKKYVKILTHERSEALIVLRVAEFVHQALGLFLGELLT